MKVRGAIQQVQADYNEAYLNVYTPNLGSVAVMTAPWGGHHVYLVKRSIGIHLLTFGSKEWADEWFESIKDDVETTEVLWKYEPEKK